MVAMAGDAQGSLIALEPLSYHTVGWIRGSVAPYRVVGPKAVRLSKRSMRFFKPTKLRIGRGQSEEVESARHDLCTPDRGQRSFCPPDRILVPLKHQQCDAHGAILVIVPGAPRVEP